MQNKLLNRKISNIHHSICNAPVTKLEKTFMKTSTFRNIYKYTYILLIHIQIYF